MKAIQRPAITHVTPVTQWRVGNKYRQIFPRNPFQRELYYSVEGVIDIKYITVINILCEKALGFWRCFLLREKYDICAVRHQNYVPMRPY